MSEVLPRITVVTPSFNQAQFLETTILSVLGQCYPNLEYIVMDGGSTDGSAEIIRRYEAQLAHWTSAPDGGQAAAINAAFARATGDILCWVNSDDFLLPGALHKIARHFAGWTHEPRLAYGACLFFHERGSRAKVVRPPEHDRARLALTAYIIQPSAFWTRALWEKAGPLDAQLAYGFDWDWFNRAAALGTFECSPELLSAYRFHEGHKSGGNSARRREEILLVARRHASPAQVAAYETALARWPATERRDTLTRRLRAARVPGAHTLAKLATPALWSRPPMVNPDDLTACEHMLRGV